MRRPGGGQSRERTWPDLIRTWLLPAWFAAVSGILILSVVRGREPFVDAQLYLAATRAWLAGADPWAVQVHGLYYGAPPPSLLPLVPFTWLPAPLDIAALVLTIAVAAVGTIALLRIPWTWLLFPPLVECVLSGNVQAVLIPLILLGWGPLAALFKIYALVPLVILGRWRAVALTAVALVVTVPILPWAQFLAQLPTITANLAVQSRYALPTPVLVLAAPFVLLCLPTLGRARAAWVLVPALWPDQQYYYGSLAIATRSAIIVALTALPVPGAAILAVFAATAEIRLRSRWRSVPADAGHPSV